MNPLLLTYNDTSLLTGDWFLMQIRSGDQIEVTLKRLCREVPGIFKSHCLELFVPVAADQDLDAIELTTIDTVFSRSDHFPTLLRCKQVTGIAGLLTMGIADAQRTQSPWPTRTSNPSSPTQQRSSYSEEWASWWAVSSVF